MKRIIFFECYIFVALLLFSAAVVGNVLQLKPQITYRNSLYQKVSEKYIQEYHYTRQIQQLGHNVTIPVPKNFTYKSPQIVFVDLGYAAEIGFGTPPQTIPLTIDTGSPSTYVKSSLCYRCDKFCVRSSDGMLYDLQTSSTSQLGSAYAVLQYGDGTLVAGFRTNDSVAFSGVSTKNVQFIAASGTTDGAEAGIIGFSRLQSRMDIADGSPVSDGGLLPQPLFYQMSQENKDIPGMFSMWFDYSYALGGNGELLIGSIDYEKLIEPIETFDVVYDQRHSIDWSLQLDSFSMSDGVGKLTNCSSKSKCYVFFDSGTSAMTLPSGLAANLKNKFKDNSQKLCSKFGITLHKRFLSGKSLDSICDDMHSKSIDEAKNWVHSHCYFEYEGGPVCTEETSHQETQSHSRNLLAGQPNCPVQQELNDYHDKYYEQQAEYAPAPASKYLSTNPFKSSRSRSYKQDLDQRACNMCRHISATIAEELKHNTCGKLLRSANFTGRRLMQQSSEDVASKISQACQEQQDSGGGAQGTFPCVQANDGPTLHFKIGGRDISLEPMAYVSQIHGTDQCTARVGGQDFDNATAGVSASFILGLPFFKKYYTVFDNDKQQVGLALSKSYSDALYGPVPTPEPKDSIPSTTPLKGHIGPIPAAAPQIQGPNSIPTGPFEGPQTQITQEGQQQGTPSQRQGQNPQESQPQAQRQSGAGQNRIGTMVTILTCMVISNFY